MHLGERAIAVVHIGERAIAVVYLGEMAIAFEGISREGITCCASVLCISESSISERGQ